VPLCTPPFEPPLCDRGQCGDPGSRYPHGVVPIDRANPDEWLAWIERMIDDYRADQRRQLLQQITKFRRLAEAHKPRVALEQSRLH
jgi:hypothetical protein